MSRGSQRRVSLAALVVSAVFLGCAGCGGGSTKSLSAIQSCLASAGFKATPTPGVSQQLSIAPSSGTATAFTVTINPSSQEAAHQVGDQRAEFGPQGANTGGGAVSQGKVVIAYARPQPASDLHKVKSCAF